ncbi:MAG TPA: 3-ketoacyl-ACP reductase [Candidatus Hydrogenedentes bacterium]|nr:3-ketoacyl-ACP reductase [Candidatus Hydrogenedentota bacterium]
MSALGTALVTGASRGIGRGIALALAAKGFNIAGVATRHVPGDPEDNLEKLRREVEALGRECLPVAGDLSDLAAHQAMVEAVIGRFGTVDVLVNNAGVAPLVRADLLECSPESYDRVLGINLRGPFFFSQTVAKRMIAQVEAGLAPPRMVFITSISSRAASPNRPEYCVSKAGLSMTAKCFAVRLAPYGIPVFDVQPGVIATDMTAAVTEKYDRLIGEGLLLTPRWGTPEDIGRAVAALAEGSFDYATGSVIEVGGGFGVERL